jgi:hypothetical protein
MAYHVVLSALHSPSEFLIHSVLLAMIAWALFRPQSSIAFRVTAAEPPQDPRGG